MADPPTTQPSLLVRVRDAGDQAAWRQFVELYAPLVYRCARRRGLQDADAADVTQEVLRAVARAIKHLEYDPQRGSFRGWLFTVVRSKLLDFHAARLRQVQRNGEPGAQDLLAEQPARDEDQAGWWDREYEQRLLAWAMEQVRGGFEPSSWQAFRMTALEGKSARDAAEMLGLSVGAVYIARSRILARLREQIRQVREIDRG
jgi:RNA polymerase sigma-70 factor (ECF subfamily)